MSIPSPSPSTRTDLCGQILSRYIGKRVLLLGIGGGGDIMGTLPTYFDLLRLGAKPTLAGLSWKRVEHDPIGRPRDINEFRHSVIVNESIACVTAQSEFDNGIRHIEADLAKLLPETPFLAINILPGVTKTRNCLLEYLQSNQIEEIIAVDVGGDALCLGDEESIRSPICDQVMLAVLSGIPNTILGIFGLGADGELPLDSFVRRFQTISALGGYRGALELTPGDIERMTELLKGAKTESSAIPVSFAAKQTGADLQRVRHQLNSNSPNPESLLADVSKIGLRSGTRTAELSLLTPFTLFFDLKTVYQTNMFVQFIDENLAVSALHQLFVKQGYITEFEDQAIRLRASG